jgi:hypothetical protein
VLKDAVLREGGLEQLVAASTAMEPGLRRSGVWAMQNLAHSAQLPIKLAILTALPWPAVSALLSDPEPDVQVSTVVGRLRLPLWCSTILSPGSAGLPKGTGANDACSKMAAAMSLQEHTFTLLRNLVHGGAEHARAVVAWTADQGNPGSGAANLLAALAAPLQPEAPSTPGQREQALFAVCNVCAGALSHQRLRRLQARHACRRAHAPHTCARRLASRL